jgi:hypothetical protein
MTDHHFEKESLAMIDLDEQLRSDLAQLREERANLERCLQKLNDLCPDSRLTPQACADERGAILAELEQIDVWIGAVGDAVNSKGTDDTDDGRRIPSSVIRQLPEALVPVH